MPAELAPLAAIPVPSQMAAIQATFDALSSLAAPAAGSSGPASVASGAPTDPFSVLLAAASTSASSAPASAATPAATAAAAIGATVPGATVPGATVPASTGAASSAAAAELAALGAAAGATTRAGGTAPPSSTSSALASAAAASPAAASPAAVGAGSSAGGGTSVGAGTAAAEPATTLAVEAQQAVQTAESSPGATGGGIAVVADAARYLGVPYVWGGTSPTTGFDCSGLVQHVFSDLGVSLPRTSYEQVGSGTSVASLAAAQPGDLLFFEPGQNGAGPGQPGHVAIYIGNNEMIAAPQTGETVQVQPVPVTPLAIRRVGVASGAASAALASMPALPAVLPNASNALSTTSGTGTSSVPGASSVAVGPVPVPGQYASLVEASAAAAGVPAPLLAAVLETESGFQPAAVSSAGAEGIAQFMPATAAAQGVQPFDPSSAIPGAARYLASLYNQFGSWSLALAAYNAGPAAVQASSGIPSNSQTAVDVATVLARAGMSTGSVA